MPRPRISVTMWVARATKSPASLSVEERRGRTHGHLLLRLAKVNHMHRDTVRLRMAEERALVRANVEALVHLTRMRRALDWLHHLNRVD